MAAQKKKTGKKAAPPPQKQVRPVRREVVRIRLLPIL